MFEWTSNFSQNSSLIGVSVSSIYTTMDLRYTPHRVLGLYSVYSPRRLTSGIFVEYYLLESSPSF